MQRRATSRWIVVNSKESFGSGRLSPASTVSSKPSTSIFAKAGAPWRAMRASRVVHGTSIWLLPLLRKDTPWDPFRDFAPIQLTVSNFLALVVHPTVPFRNVKDLVAYGKANLAGYKCPTSVDFVTALPRNPSGKVLKRMLRDELAPSGGA